MDTYAVISIMKVRFKPVKGTPPHTLLKKTA